MTLGAATDAGTNVSKHFRNRTSASTLKTEPENALMATVPRTKSLFAGRSCAADV